MTRFLFGDLIYRWHIFGFLERETVGAVCGWHMVLADCFMGLIMKAGRALHVLKVHVLSNPYPLANPRCKKLWFIDLLILLLWLNMSLCSLLQHAPLTCQPSLSTLSSYLIPNSSLGCMRLRDPFLVVILRKLSTFLCGMPPKIYNWCYTTAELRHYHKENIFMLNQRPYIKGRLHCPTIELSRTQCQSCDYPVVHLQHLNMYDPTTQS